MPGYLIKDTTEEERRKIVEDSLGMIGTDCEGSMNGLAEMYEAYIRGEKEIREINMEFNRKTIKDMEREDHGSSCMMY